MKNKIITIAVMLAVMMAMTGVVAANPEHMNAIVPDPAILGMGETCGFGTPVTFTTGLTDIEGRSGGNTHTTSVEIQVISGVGASINDLQFKIIDPFSGSSVCLSNGGSKSWNDGLTIASPLQSIGPIKVEVWNTASIQNSHYAITIKDNFPLSATALDKADATTKGNTIPEFPTVALPVAAIIGLVFLFQQKKRKQE